MVIFLYGADTLRLNRKVKQVISEYQSRAKHSDFIALDATKNSSEDFFQLMRQNSLFAAKKFFVIKDPLSNKEFKEAAVKKIKEIALLPHNFLFYQQGKILKTDRFLQSVSKHGQTQEFSPLKGADLERWIVAEIAALGRHEGKAIAPLLARRVGNDLWQMVNEIQKLHHFAAGRTIIAADIEKNVFSVLENNIFETADAIADGDRERAAKLVKRHLADGDHPLYLLAIIAGHFKNLFLIKTCSDAGARRLGMHPYVFFKASAQARRFDALKLKNICGRIRQTDFDIKSGRVDAFVGLDLLMVGI